MLRFFLCESKNIRRAEVVFIFPYHHIGGAENVHYNIINAVKDYKPYTFFTKQSRTPGRLNDFKIISNCETVFKFVRHEGYIKRLFIKRLSIMLNDSTAVVSVFGSNNEFFYQLLPQLNKDIKTIDLTHAFSKPDYGIEQFSVNYISLLDLRITINEKTKNDFLTQYKNYGMEGDFIKRIICIPNGVKLPAEATNRENVSNLKVGFFGRWSKEKRPELFLEVAKQVSQKVQGILFKMAGSGIHKQREVIEKFNVICLGELSDKTEISNFYKSIDVLVLTSYREGFPMVIMEAMSHGVIVISTDVGSIADHLKSNYNGFLIVDVNPKSIIRSISKKIVVLSEDIELKKSMQSKAFSYAKANFGIEEFNKAYRKLLIDD